MKDIRNVGLGFVMFSLFLVILNKLEKDAIFTPLSRFFSDESYIISIYILLFAFILFIMGIIIVVFPVNKKSNYLDK